jgi:hypothetical protein
MRRRSSVLLLAVIALLAGSAPAAAQEPVAAEPVATPAPADPPSPVAEPPAAQPEPGAPEPAEPAPQPEAAQPEAAQPEPAQPEAAQPAQPAPAAPAAAAAPAPARAVPAAAPRRAAPKVPQRRRAPNQEQVDGRLVFFDGRVSVGGVSPAPCATDDCALADYEIQDLEVRSDPADPPLIAVSRARAGGPASARTVEVEVTLRPPGAEAAKARITLDPLDDLLDPATYEGTPLESAIGEVLKALAPLTGPGGALENLSITFGPGFVTSGSVDAAGISTSSEGYVVTAPVAGRPSPGVGGGGGGDSPAAPPRARPVPDSPDSGDDPQAETKAALQRPYGEVLGSEQDAHGGGTATAVADFATSVFGALVSGACEAVADRKSCDHSTPPPPFVVALLTAVLFVTDDGEGQVELRCPAGYEGVSGTLRITTEIRLGQKPRELATEVRFTCDEPIEEVRVALLPDALDRLEGGGSMTARLTVIAFTSAGARDSDVVEQASIRLRTAQNAPG